VEDEKVPVLLGYLKELDSEAVNLGLKAFVWNIEEGM
jgi:acylphosphatase